MQPDMIINIRLHPYLIAYLENKFGGQPIRFNKGHFLNICLYAITTKPPRGYKELNFEKYNCKVYLPYLNEKNPAVYFYISDRGMSIFQDRVRDLFKADFHCFINHNLRKGIKSRKYI